MALVIGAANGCASPVAGLWPPAEGASRHRIIVSIDQWHSVIGLWPEDGPAGERAADLQEWGYAERGFYLEGDSGCWGTTRALFWPSDGVVQVSRLGRPFSERTIQPPARQWTFYLSEDGYRALRAHLEAERSSTEPIAFLHGKWYPATHDYHTFHHCHHWTARALRAAGLPVWSFYAVFKSCLEAQLDRAAEMDKQGSRHAPRTVSRAFNNSATREG